MMNQTNETADSVSNALKTAQDQEDREWLARVTSWSKRAIVVALVLWLGFGTATVWFSNWESFSKAELAASAQLGDTFGATNALFSALAVGLVAVSTVLQTQELRAQRHAVTATQAQLKAQLEELALAREETRLTREEHAKTAAALAKQVELSTLSAAVSSTASLASAFIESSNPGAVEKQFSQLVQKSNQEEMRSWLSDKSNSRQVPDRAVVHIVELQELQKRLLTAIEAVSGN